MMLGLLTLLHTSRLIMDTVTARALSRHLSRIFSYISLGAKMGVSANFLKRLPIKSLTAYIYPAMTISRLKST